MKHLVTFARVLVGVLFIVSGLVKANDPLGLSYKMLEFFEIWSAELAASHHILKTPLLGILTFSNAHALSLSFAMIVLEIMAGIALLLGWQKKATLWLLLVLIVFFTFLTGYAYASGKFKNCGCFGDCLPISPLASFVKDLFLLALIGFLLIYQKYVYTLATAKMVRSTLLVALLASIGVQLYVLRYLPLVDCLPFKSGANIKINMLPPPNSITDSFAIRFVYKKEGKQFEFSPEDLPTDLSTYTFIERTDKLVRKGNAEPAIKGFALTGQTRIDSTNEVLNAPNAVLYFYDTEKGLDPAIRANLLTVYKTARNKNIPVYVVTTSIPKLLQNERALNVPGLQFFDVDFTIFRTAARTNPCIYVLQNGTIIQKQSRFRTNAVIATLDKL